MWADTLFRAEQHHALQLLLWAAASVVAGSALYTVLARQRSGSPLLRHFSLQMFAWGIVVAALGANAWHGVEMRDLAAATRLERGLWLAIGLEIGLVAVGATMALSAWLSGRRLGGVGAGIAVIVQGLALLVLDLKFLSTFSR